MGPQQALGREALNSQNGDSERRRPEDELDGLSGGYEYSTPKPVLGVRALSIVVCSRRLVLHASLLDSFQRPENSDSTARSLTLLSSHLFQQDKQREEG